MLHSAHIPLLLKLTQVKTIFPFYHTVSNYELPYIKHLYKIKSVNQFIDDIDNICTYFKPIDVFDLIQFSKGNISFNKPVFHLSFDDGLKECFELIRPILLKKGIPASFFINPAFIDNATFFYRFKISLIINSISQNPKHLQDIKLILKNYKYNVHNDVKELLLSLNQNDILVIEKLSEELKINDDLNKYKPYLTTENIKQLLNDGFTIGAHSFNHYNFQFLSENEIINEIITGISYFKEKYNLNYSIFSYPFTNHFLPLSFFNKLKQNNKYPYDIAFGTSGIKNDIDFHFQRIAMENNDKSAQNIINSQISLYLIKKVLFKTNIKR